MAVGELAQAGTQCVGGIEQAVAGGAVTGRLAATLAVADGIAGDVPASTCA